MKVRLKPTVIAGVLLGLLVASSLLGAQLQRDRGYTVLGVEQFEQQYRSSIADLHNAMGSVTTRFLQNEGEWEKIELPPPSSSAEVLVEAPKPAIAELPVIRGISWNPENPLVMVNDQLYKLGDSINGYIVKDILKDRVVIESPAGKEQLLKLREDLP